MKTIKRLTVLTGTALLSGALLSPSAFAATSVLPEGTSPGAGRDHGWGNCGYNNGGVPKLTGQELRTATGMGGYKPGDDCPPVKAPPVVRTTEPTTETSTGSTDMTDVTIDTDLTGSVGSVDGTKA